MNDVTMPGLRFRVEHGRTRARPARYDHGRPIVGPFIAFLAAVPKASSPTIGVKLGSVPPAHVRTNMSSAMSASVARSTMRKHCRRVGVPIEGFGLEPLRDVGEKGTRTALRVDRVSALNRCVKLNQILHRVLPVNPTC